MGPGIYGGIVRRDAEGEIVIGDQYQGNDQSVILDFKSYVLKIKVTIQSPGQCTLGAATRPSTRG